MENLQKIIIRGDDDMLKQMAWNTFKKTGNLDTFVELMQVEEVEKKLKAEEYGDNQNQRNNFK